MGFNSGFKGLKSAEYWYKFVTWAAWSNTTAVRLSRIYGCADMWKTSSEISCNWRHRRRYSFFCGCISPVLFCCS